MMSSRLTSAGDIVASENWIQANGLRIRSLVAGPDGGQPVLLLHGFPEGAESWGGQLEALAAAGFRAVAPDLRGYGGTDCPDGEEAYRLDHLVADVRALIAALGAPAYLVGHDWGGLIGWTLVSRHPELVRTWTALSVPHPIPLIEASRDDPDQQARSAYVRLFRMAGKAEAVLSENGHRRLRAMYRVGPDTRAVPDDVVDRYVAGLARPGRLTAALGYYRANLAGDTWATFPPTPAAIRTPTLLVWGDRDPALGRRAAEATGAHVAGPYRLAVLEGAGHWLQFERPAEVSRLILEHVGGA